jgi:hypothetical protein
VNRARIEAAWARNPALSIEQVRRLTGAPSATVRHVWRQLLAAGRLPPPKNRNHERDSLRAVAS